MTVINEQYHRICTNSNRISTVTGICVLFLTNMCLDLVMPRVLDCVDSFTLSLDEVQDFAGHLSDGLAVGVQSLYIEPLQLPE